MAGNSTKRKTTAKTTGKTTGKKKDTRAMEQDTGFLRTEAAVLVTFAVCAFLFLSNFHICGVLGNFLSRVMLGVFGSIGYVAPLLGFMGMVFYVSNKGNIRAVYKMLAVELLLLVLCGLAQLAFGGGYQEGQTLKEVYETAGESGLGGGIIGGALVLVLHTAVGTIGAYLVLLVCMIICLVCITEKSFVSAVKRGSGKAYQYAREDYGRRKEIREEKKEERRLLREEQKVQGVNLNSTDLSKNIPVPLPSEEEGAPLPEKLPKPKTEHQEKEHMASGTETSPEDVVPPIPDPADVFKGKITMPGQKKEEDVVPFEEDLSLMRHQLDEDVFVSRNGRDFDDMDVFPKIWGKESGETGTAREERKAVPKESPMVPATEPEDSTGMKFWTEPDTGDGDRPGFRKEPGTGEKPGFGEEPGTGEKPGFGKEPEFSAKSERKPETVEEELHTEPYVETEEYWEPVMQEPKAGQETAAQGVALQGPGTQESAVQEPVTQGSSLRDEELHTWEERKQVVTATGKVIETDAEEIIKKKAEKRKMDAAEKEEASTAVRQEIKKTEEKPKKPYQIPPMDLLTRGKGPAGGQSEKEFKETAIKLQQTLRNFGVGVTVTNISCGPTVTRYELHPEQGVKVSKIQSLADDIKLNLAATDIRIEAPIPGKAAVGIEVPNKVNSMVYLRELLESEEFRKHPSRLAFAVGKDIGGQVVIADLAKMPHLLIAGQTGSGKSVGINTMIMSFLYRASPDDVKIIMIDPKVVELSIYNKIPHLLIPVVTDPKKAAGALNWAVAEMMDRYNKFAESNVRDLKGYNARVKTLEDSGDVPKEEIPSKLPQIVIIIDELADLMMVASGEVEDAICRLAQLARAAGIHLVIATQRPSVNVITGVIKANVPSRIAFSVASGVDSRTILDMNGAEKLLGNGDMLFYPSGYAKPLRVQGAFVSDQEVSKVTDFLKEQNEDMGYDREVEMKMSQSGTQGGGSSGSDRDALFTDAGKFIIEKDKASIGMLQRMFKIGFNRAARIMDQLAEAGVVGEEEGTKPRKILMSLEEFEEYIEAGY